MNQKPPDLNRIDPNSLGLQTGPEADKVYAMEAILADIRQELKTAMAKWPAMNSAHEGYGVLLEEVDELWDHVKTNQKKRDLVAMKKEAVQVAAMAIRFAVEVCNEERGRK